MGKYLLFLLLVQMYRILEGVFPQQSHHNTQTILLYIWDLLTSQL